MVGREKAGGMMLRVGAALACVLVACACLLPATAFAADGEAGSEKAALASEKSETVRVIADASGDPVKVEVQTTLRNADSEAVLSDETDLSDIKPGENSGTYTEKDGALIWQADGEDIVYTGTTEKEIPVKVKVSYTLDGKEMAPEDMAGASGHVVIRYDYANTAIVDGTAIPFTMITAILLDDARFSKVKVTNGKLISDDGRTIVVGYALPGMQASLELDKKDAELPEYFEFEADVVDFKLNASLTMASTDLFNDFTAEDLDISELSDEAGELSSALSKIIDATKEFSDGLKELNDGAKTLADALANLNKKLPDMADAISKLASGSQKLNQGLGDVAEGVENLDTGATGVSGGISTLINGDGVTSNGLSGAISGVETLIASMETLVNGVNRLVDATGLPLAQSAATQIAGWLSQDSIGALTSALGSAKQELSTDSTAIATIQTQAGTATTNLSAAQTALSAIDTSKITDPDVKAEIEAQILAAQNSVGTAQTSVTAIATSAGGLSATATDAAIGEIQNAMTNLTLASMCAQRIADGLGGAIDEINQKLKPGLASIKEGLSKLLAGLNDALSGLKTLSDYAQRVASGASSLSSDMAGVLEGAGGLEQGLNTLNQNTGDMQSGVDALAGGAADLQEGTESAEQGAGELLDGLQTYNDEGINELVKKIDEDLQGFIDRFLASSDLGREYDNFTGKAQGTPSTVKFVYEIAGISAEA